MSTPPPACASSDRNLLVGILALQADLISRDSLISAMSAWTLAKSRPLGEILLEQGAFDVEAHALVEGLVRKSLARHDGDAEQSLAALSSIDTTRQQLQQLGDPDVNASLPKLSASRSSADPHATQGLAVGSSTSSGLRFRIVRHHAKGGLGQVSVAIDQELHREVALKEIQDQYADLADHRSRFLREAEITGGLEHPGIVPVYGLGQYADGRPFYAMRFIKGDNLKSAIERFHRTKFNDPGQRTLELRKLLGRFLDVCNAVAYAHSRGVLHRDLKPGNIMLGHYGETLVVDWGLAKTVEQADARDGLDEAPVRPASGSDVAVTRMGQRIGTLAYMSPEQARGDWDRVRSASDVYSLGATLYCVLTGQSPFLERDPDVIEKVERGQFAPPRQANSRVPPALEAICLKAMAARPESRYPSPRALAADVEHWLADAPVAAHRESVLPRVARWARRHRPIVAGAAALLLTAVIALTAGIFIVNREKQRTQKALIGESEARGRTRKALNEMSSQVIEDWLSKRGELEPAQKTFLEKSLAYYQEFAAESGQTEEVRRSVADAHLRVGKIRYRLGQHKEAMTAYQRAQELYASLAADFPSVPEYPWQAAKSYGNLGILLAETGRLKEAEAPFRDALALQKQLVTDLPSAPQYRQDLATSHNSLGALMADMGRPKEAEIFYGEALAIRNQLADDIPNVPQYRLELAQSLNNMGNLLKNKGQPKEAEARHRRALAIEMQLVADFPALPRYRQDLARSYHNLGELLRAMGRMKDAEAAYRDALAIAKQLAADFPTVPQYRQDLARSQYGLGAQLRDAGRPEEAVGAYRDGLAIQKQLAADFSTVPQYRAELGWSHHSLGVLLKASGRPKEAEAAFHDALALQQRLAAELPKMPDLQCDIANSLEGLAELARDRKEFAAARQRLEQAHPHIQAALEANPDDPFSRAVYCENRKVLAATLLDLSDHGAAAEAATDLARVASKPAADTYDAACFLSRCVSLAEKDPKLPPAKQKELAKSYGDRAMEMLRHAVAKGHKNVTQIKKDTDLDPLRSRDDLKKLLADMEKQAK
jgi:serine/threonine-protein kinase